MVSFSALDIFIIIAFFISVLAVGFWADSKDEADNSGYLLSGRKIGLLLFILTNVATWYGGILGVGEFTYRSGLLSWFTQGFSYYIFAIIFAFFFAEKIRNASLFTIPDKLEQVYGKKVGILSSILVFILVSPAPYILMVGSLIQLIFGINLFLSLIIAVLLSSAYLIKGGLKSDVYTDVIQFFVMFIGFILIVFVSFSNFGGIEFLQKELPPAHLKLSGDASPVYVIVWFLIAMWTFADPGFHQRCNAAKNGKTAKYGILISIILWAFFDFLTTTTGLYSRAVLPNLQNPVLSFPLYAEKVLGSGAKGIFYAALFATIISTANSFLFLSGTTFGRDFIYKMKKGAKESELKKYTRIGLIASSIISILMAYYIQSVISLWYLVGSICIPGIVFLIFGAYYEKLKVSNKFAVIEIFSAVFSSIAWMHIRDYIQIQWLKEIEPMIAGIFTAIIIHFIGLIKLRYVSSSSSAIVQ
jgi:solute:Na+ symporter, SSS family